VLKVPLISNQSRSRLPLCVRLRWPECVQDVSVVVVAACCEYARRFGDSERTANCSAWSRTRRIWNEFTIECGNGTRKANRWITSLISRNRTADRPASPHLDTMWTYWTCLCSRNSGLMTWERRYLQSLFPAFKCDAVKDLNPICARCVLFIAESWPPNLFLFLLIRFCWQSVERKLTASEVTCVCRKGLCVGRIRQIISGAVNKPVKLRYNVLTYRCISPCRIPRA